MSRKARKRRIGEEICKCFAYRFPHRMLGGRCDGGAFVQDYFDNQMWGGCKGCIFRIMTDEGTIECQVVGGLDKLLYCPALREHVGFHSIKLYGVNGPDRHKSL